MVGIWWRNSFKVVGRVSFSFPILKCILCEYGKNKKREENVSKKKEKKKNHHTYYLMSLLD